jgi:hypothetical protein
MQETFQRAIDAHRRGDYDTAYKLYVDLLKYKTARYNLGVLCRQLGRLEESEVALRPIVEKYPNDIAARFALAMTFLSAGQYSEGWPLYEARRFGTNISIFEPETSAPEWGGEDLFGRRIVVCAEQGFGDQIMFARYLSVLRASGAEVLVACSSTIQPLFERWGFATTVYHRNQRAIPPCDFWAFFCSLPLRLGMNDPAPESPQSIPLSAGDGIGVMTAGDPIHANDQNRSLPLEMAKRLLAIGRDLRPEATGARNFLHTAELISRLDLVVTVDTAMAHLAGSLGVKTWVLLPAFGTDWRWRRGRKDTAWYASLSLLRQPSPGDWGSVLNQVSARL